MPIEFIRIILRKLVANGDELMQFEPPRRLPRKLVEFLSKVALFVVLAPIVTGIAFYVVHRAAETRQNELVEANFSKVKVGMTSAQIEAVLGWPDAIYLNAEDQSNRLRMHQALSWFTSYRMYWDVRTDYRGIPINTQGREVWIYDSYKYQPIGSPLNAPAIVFDVETGKVMQLTEVFYIDS